MEISIQPITRRNRQQILGLSLADAQKNFIESPEECLQEARRIWRWRPVAICAEEQVVGFAMYGNFPQEGARGRVWLDRLLIDRKFQGIGYGSKAILTLCDRLKQQYHCEEIYLSCYPENKVALALYQKLGFQFTGEKDINGEDVMVLK